MEIIKSDIITKKGVFMGYSQVQGIAKETIDYIKTVITIDLSQQRDNIWGD